MPDPLRAIYYPFSRTLDETTLKRAILLYDEVLFIDPKTPKVRAGLYSADQHQPYLPDHAAQRLQDDWERITDHYALLEREGMVRFVDPAPILERPALDEVITGSMQADMLDKSVLELFARHPRSWSMLRSRIPLSAMPYLSHQYTPRVLYDGNVHGPFEVRHGRGYALFADGKPDQEFSLPDWPKRDAVPERAEWAAVLPYYLGSSLATSTALAMAVETEAIPLTDSDAHFRLLSARFARAAATPISEIPGLKPTYSPALAQKYALVEQRVVDSILGYDDLAALSLEDCLRYRSETSEQREKFRDFLSGVVGEVRNQAWSPEVEAEIGHLIAKAQRATEDHAGALRDAHWKLFKKSLVGTAVAATPVLLTAVFPGVSPLWALLLGGGSLSATLADPIKDLAMIWLDRKKEQSGLSYLMNLPVK
jgi:hypothetical protein